MFGCCSFILLNSTKNKKRFEYIEALMCIKKKETTNETWLISFEKSGKVLRRLICVSAPTMHASKGKWKGFSGSGRCQRQTESLGQNGNADCVKTRGYLGLELYA